MNFIELKSVTKQAKNNLIIDHVSFAIEKGSIVTLEGINGSGKTMLLKAILGLIKTSGEITVNGSTVSISEKFPVKAGILIENPSLIESFDAYTNLDLLARLQDNIHSKEINELLNYFELNNKKNLKVKKFSLGMKQKLGISQALLGRNELIILDEPTNALDQESITKLVQIIKEINEEGSTFIIASHDHDFIEKISDQRLYVRDGQVYEDI